MADEGKDLGGKCGILGGRQIILILKQQNSFTGWYMNFGVSQICIPLPSSDFFGPNFRS